MFRGRPKVEEIMAYFPALIPKSLITPKVEIIRGMNVIEKFQKRVEEHCIMLRTKSRSELLGLNDAPVEEVDLGGQAGTIAFILEEETKGSLRIVVQGFLDTKLLPSIGVKHVALDGFRMNADDTLSPLRDEEFYEFD